MGWGLLDQSPPPDLAVVGLQQPQSHHPTLGGAAEVEAEVEQAADAGVAGAVPIPPEQAAEVDAEAAPILLLESEI